MEHSKRITKNGAVTIPAALRRDLGIGGGERVKLEVQPGGEIVLRRITGVCIFCKTDQGELYKYRGRFVCESCLVDLLHKGT